MCTHRTAHLRAGAQGRSAVDRHASPGVRKGGSADWDRSSDRLVSGWGGVPGDDYTAGLPKYFVVQTAPEGTSSTIGRGAGGGGAAFGRMPFAANSCSQNVCANVKNGSRACLRHVNKFGALSSSQKREETFGKI
eukprot:1188311-Prorocentrum_minimum.AAC.3